MGKFTLCIITISLCFCGKARAIDRESVLKGHPPVLLESTVANLPQDKAMAALQKVIKEVAPIARGTQIHQGKMLEVYTESLRKFKSLDPEKSLDWLFSEGEMWFQLWERITFEEGRFASFVEVIKMRETLWAAMDEKLRASAKPANEFQRWLEGRKPNYPIERIFLLEAKARWPNSLLKSAEKMTQFLQKKSDLPLSVISKSIRLKPTQEVQVLEREWSETQIQVMKTEISNYEKLLKYAAERAKEATR